MDNTDRDIQILPETSLKISLRWSAAETASSNTHSTKQRKQTAVRRSQRLKTAKQIKDDSKSKPIRKTTRRKTKPDPQRADEMVQYHGMEKLQSTEEKTRADGADSSSHSGNLPLLRAATTSTKYFGEHILGQEESIRFSQALHHAQPGRSISVTHESGALESERSSSRDICPLQDYQDHLLMLEALNKRYAKSARKPR